MTELIGNIGVNEKSFEVSTNRILLVLDELSRPDSRFKIATEFSDYKAFVQACAQGLITLELNGEQIFKITRQGKDFLRRGGE